MKHNINAKSIFSISLLFFATACTAQPMKDMKMSTNGQHTSQDITFSQGKLIEIAYLTPIPDMQESLKHEYFPKAKRLAKEYGAKMLGKFKVIKKTGGEMDAKILIIFEWPDVASKKAFDADTRYHKIKPVRDDAFSYMRFAFYEVKKDVTITFQKNKVYEFFGAWLNDNGQEKLNQYFKVSTPIKKNYGRPAPVFKTMLSSVKNTPMVGHGYTPHMAGIVEWDKSDDFYELLRNKDFKKNAAPLMKAAIRRIDMLHTKIILN